MTASGSMLRAAALPAVLAALLAGGCSGQRGALQPERSPFTGMDADGDGYLVPAELDAGSGLAGGFARWDEDGDGRISYPEFNRYRGHALP